MADGWSLPECVATNDHDWHGGGICSMCGTRLRCACGAFMRESAAAWDAHFMTCPHARLPILTDSAEAGDTDD